MRRLRSFCRSKSCSASCCLSNRGRHLACPASSSTLIQAASWIRALPPAPFCLRTLSSSPQLLCQYAITLLHRPSSHLFIGSERNCYPPWMTASSAVSLIYQYSPNVLVLQFSSPFLCTFPTSWIQRIDVTRCCWAPYRPSRHLLSCTYISCRLSN